MSRPKRLRNKKDAGITRDEFDRLAELYGQRWHVGLCAVSAEGRIVFGRAGCDMRESSICMHIRKLSVESAARWGEPTVEACPGHRLLWAVPLMNNARIVGGLISSAAERDVFPVEGGPAALDIRAACTDLRLLAEEANLTNAAFLEARRVEYLHEQQKAAAIQEFKVSPHDDIREMYLRQEPELIAAIRKDDRRQARQIINNMLVAMLHRAGESLSLIKTFFMELVVTMCRTAVEAGGKPEELLGADFESLSHLSQIQSEEQLAPWLHNILDHVMDSITTTPGRPDTVPVTLAMEFMAEHMAEDITRNDIARAAHISPFHFSRLFTERIGRTCSDMLNQMRVDRASEMLVRGDSTLVRIAMECGFKDQSYFTKVFRRFTGKTPRQYRTNHKSE